MRCVNCGADTKDTTVCSRCGMSPTMYKYSFDDFCICPTPMLRFRHSDKTETGYCAVCKKLIDR